jgi:hypothetical protein
LRPGRADNPFFEKQKQKSKSGKLKINAMKVKADGNPDDSHLLLALTHWY